LSGTETHLTVHSVRRLTFQKVYIVLISTAIVLKDFTNFVRVVRNTTGIGTITSFVKVESIPVIAGFSAVNEPFSPLL
jgi:hypothetical protein